MNFAEVSLLLENVDNLYPDYHEVVITRRIQIGRREYYLNKTPCRLKDVLELFGIRGSVLNIFSCRPGRIEQIINARAEDQEKYLKKLQNS